MVDNEPGIRLYERLGFRVEGRQSNQVRLEDGLYADLIFRSLFLNSSMTV